MKKLLLLSIPLLLGGVSCMSPQSIFEKARATSMTDEAPDNIKSMCITQEIELKDQKVSGTIITNIKFPDKMSIHSNINQFDTTHAVINGKNGVEASKIRGIRNYSDSERESMAFIISSSNPMTPIESIFESFERLPDQNNCYVIRCTPNKKNWKYISPYIYYIDKNNFLLKKEESTLIQEETLIPVCTEYFKYKNIQGLLVPEESRTSQDQQKIDMYLIDVKLNTPCLDGQFLPPEDHF